MNSNLTLKFVLYLTIAVSGTTQYFLSTNLIVWAAYGVSSIVAIFFLLNHPNKFRFTRSLRFFKIHLVLMSVYFFFTLFSEGGIVSSISGLKNHVGMILFGIMVAVGGINYSKIKVIVDTLLVIFWLQLPVVIVQHFYFARTRTNEGSGGVSFDSIVGTFGGNPYGGGFSGSLGLFIGLVLLIKAAEFNNGKAILVNFMLYLIVGLAILVVGEIQFSLLLTPLFIVYIFIFQKTQSKSVIEKAGKVVPLMLMLLGLLIGAITILSNLQGAEFNNSGLTITERLTDKVDRFLDPRVDYFSKDSGLVAINQTAALSYWETRTYSSDFSRYFGFGLNVANPINTDSLANYHGFNAGRTTISTILWEMGLVGSFIYLFNWALMIFQLRKTYEANLIDDTSKFGYLETPIWLFLVMAFFSIFYDSSLVLNHAISFLAFFSVGLLILIRRRSMYNSHAHT